jgi:hypothetical protein
MEVRFSRRWGFISGVCCTFINALYDIALLSDKPRPIPPSIPIYAENITAKMGYTNVWGFIDGTLKKICRPTYFQKAAYSGHQALPWTKVPECYNT